MRTFSLAGLLVLSSLAVNAQSVASLPTAAAGNFASADAGADTLAAPLLQGAHTLGQLLNYALAHNLDLQVGRADGNAAQARAQAAQGSALPRITIEAASSLYSPDLRLTAARFNGEPGVFGNNVNTLDLVLRVPLYTGGRLQADIRAAELLQAAVDHRLARTRGDLVFNVSSLFYGLVAQERLIDALAQSEQALQSQLERVKQLVQARKAAAVDALRAEVRLGDVHQRLLRERNSQQVLRQALFNLLGGVRAAPDFALQADWATPRAAIDDMDALLEVALQQRADVAAAQAELQAQAERIVSAQAGLRPKLNLIASAGQRLMLDPVQQPAGLSTRDNVARLGLTLEVPLFDGHISQARVQEEQAKWDAQEQRWKKLRLQVQLELTNAHANLASALARVQSAEGTVALARKVFDIEQEKYALARGTVQDVLDAQSAWLDAQATHIRALADAHTARAQLELALGKNLS